MTSRLLFNLAGSLAVRDLVAGPGVLTATAAGFASCAVATAATWSASPLGPHGVLVLGLATQAAGMSERRACRFTGFARSNPRYRTMYAPEAPAHGARDRRVSVRLSSAG